ncbi:DUF4249 domain-containing protein [Maribacter sp. X9]|uniref:DUF4249 domain-containing protein n=1 Tax=Maribacter sp. X9 TaxID=3402159 RepID=UPI003AF3E9DF
MKTVNNKIFKKGKVIVLIAISMFVQACIEPFDIEKTEFTSAVVIEGTLTDQNMKQRILISRTFPLDTVVSAGISKATIVINDSNGISYEFMETSGGEYVSTTAFGAMSGVGYTLSVKLPDGSSYISEEVILPTKSKINELYVARDFNNGELAEGMFIYVDSFDPTGQSKFYRYEYEETYKIIAPFWSPEDAYVVSPLPNPQVDFRARTNEERVCYKTVESNKIIQENTTEYSEDRVTKFPVRFINKENFILSHRYSILVKQFVQSPEAFTYFETLESIAASGSLFSQIQTGFIEGNIKSLTNKDEKVIGFFQASTVSEKRVFFDYADYFPGERLPKYPTDCSLVSPPLITEGMSSPLIDAINQETLKYVSEYDQQTNPNNYSESGPFLMIQTPCGDCTVLGSNIVPDFWVED